jgi:predicted ATPase
VIRECAHTHIVLGRSSGRGKTTLTRLLVEAGDAGDEVVVLIRN